ncbi:GNAT family N-acetyltransferase [Caulobacter sp. UNC358MFTsu5.1]|uniref:GNAT family N-acetyltransferase n=1 Tax=Caulobacter sp. UNC358MFTsu5.1 TaxID=1449049 RepID=UPI000690B77B|nr:GNAT family N-acetyltransferase [Caulobacter sp. UNC358MFTsu5.1]
MSIVVKDAQERSDGAHLRALLQACGLSTIGLFSPGSVYVMALRDQSVIGVCGLERDGPAGLLRSLAVDPSARGARLSWRLVDVIVRRARMDAVERLFTFSKDTGDLFTAMGWRDVPLSKALPHIGNTAQVRHYDDVGWYPDERALSIDLAQPRMSPRF